MKPIKIPELLFHADGFHVNKVTDKQVKVIKKVNKVNKT